MAPDTFDRQVETTRQHLAELENLTGLPLEQEAILGRTITQLSVALEGLAVAQEEIRQQNEELIAMRHAVEAERRRYQELFDFAPDAYLVTDPSGIIEEANRAATTLLNVGRDLMVAKPLILFVSERDRRTFSDLLLFLRTGQETASQEWELALQPKDRPPFPAALTIAPVHSAQGELVGLRWLVRDLTASRRAEERERLLTQIARDRQAIEGLIHDLERERETLQTIMDNTHAQLAYLDSEFSFVRVNSAYAAGSGHAKEELLGHSHFDLFPDPENQAIFQQVRDTGRPVRFQARPFEFADQPERGISYWDWSLVPVKDERGQVQGLVLSLLDATEAERAKQEREGLLAENRQQRRFLERLVETAPIGIAAVAGADRHYELVNPHYQAILGLPGEALLGRTVAEVLPAAAAQAILEPVEEVYRTGQTVSVRQYEAPVELAQAQTYWNVDYVPLKSDQGDVDGVLILATEVTDSVLARQQIEALAAEAQRQADEMAAVFAAMNDGVIVYDAEGFVRHANPAAVDLFGLDPVGMERDAINQRLIKSYLDGKPVAREDLPSARALRGEKVVDQRLHLSNSMGTKSTVLVSSAPILTDGSVVGAVLAWHDVTAREEAEQARNRLVAVLEQTPDVVFTSSVDGELLYLNQAGRQILGIAAGADLSGGATVDGYPAWTNAIIHHTGVPFAIREGLWRGETVVVSHEGRQISMSLVVVAHKAPDGRVEYLSTIARDITERRQMETALRESQEKLQVLFDSLPVGVSVVDENRNVIEANPALERILDISREGLLRGEYERRRYLRHDGTPFPAEEFPSIRAFREGKMVQNVEIGAEREDGSVIWTLVSAVPLPFSDWRLLITTMDITGRRRAEEALRKSEERYRYLFNGMTEGFALHEIVRDAQGKPCDYRFLEINPAFEKLTGLKREKLLGRTVLEALPDTEPFWIQTYVHAALAGGTVHFEQYSRPLDRYYEVVSFRPAENQFATLFLDVTDRKQAQKALQRAHDELEQRVQERTAALQASEERFRQLAEHISEVFWMSDAQYSQILYVSPQYEDLTGRTCQSLYERPDSFLDMVHPEDRQRLVDALEPQVWQDHDEEYRVLLPDGSVRWVRTRAFPIQDESGAVYRIAGIAEDVTERVEARQMLEQRVEERTRELKTLLEISRSMALTLELDPMLTMILDRLRDVVYYDGATVFKVEEGILSALVHRGPIPQQELSRIQSSAASTPMVRAVTDRQAPIIVPDVRGDTSMAQAFRRSVGERIETRYGHVRSWMGLPLTIKDQTVGLLALHCSEPDCYTAPQADLALAFASQAAIAIETAHLYEQARALAAVEERQRLARELHDAVSQTLFSASLSAEVLPRLWERNPEEGRRCLDELHRLTRGALAEMRTLLLELRPSALTETSLGDLLHQLAEAITNRTRLSMTLNIDRRCPLPPEVQVALYRIAQEALNNVAKHAEATQVAFVLRCAPALRAGSGAEGQAGGVELRIEDDGRGFDETCIPPDCLGLSIMRERAEAIGAAIEIKSQIDRGTRVGVVWRAT